MSVSLCRLHRLHFGGEEVISQALPGRTCAVVVTAAVGGGGGGRGGATAGQAGIQGLPVPILLLLQRRFFTENMNISLKFCLQIHECL